MRLCGHDCIPCCIFCKYMIPDVENSINFGLKGCNLYLDEEHQEIADACGYCDNFVYMNAEDKI